jgi:hypothetical protein
MIDFFICEKIILVSCISNIDNCIEKFIALQMYKVLIVF